MNFRWSNIYVLQLLAVLNVNGLKLIPADRTIIKQNGTTRTISRYFLLPHEGDKGNTNIARDAGFSKFLREFEKNTDSLKVPPGKKKVVDRYRIYIRRKLKKNPKKDLGKSPNNQQKYKPVASTSTDHYYTQTTQMPTKGRTFKTPSDGETTDDEYIIKKNQVELTGAFPNLLFGEKPAQTRESSENLVDLKDPYDILKAAAEVQAQKKLGQLLFNGTLDTTEQKTVQMISKVGENENVKIPRPIETLTQAEINELFAQLYGKYVPAQIPTSSEQREPKLLSANVNIVVDGSAKQIPEHIQKDAAFQLLSALHQTPEKLNEKAAASTVINQHTPTEGKEYAEINSEEAQNSQTLSPSLITNSYESTNIPLISKAVLINSQHSNSNVKGNNPLENYFLQFGNENPDKLFNDESKTVDVNSTSSSTSSYGSSELSTVMGNIEKGKLLNHPLAGYKGKNSPILLNYNHAGIEHTEPPDFSFTQVIKGGTEYSQTSNKPVTVNPGDIDFSSLKTPSSDIGTEISQTVTKPEELGLNQEPTENLSTSNNPSTLVLDQATTESENSKNPSSDSSSVDYSETTQIQPLSVTENRYTSSKVTPSLEVFDITAGDYSKTSRSPDSMNNSPNPDDAVDDDDLEYKFNTEYVLPSTENLESSSINGDLFNTTDENKLRGGIGDEWTTMYQEDEGQEDEVQPKQPNIDTGDNIVEISDESEHSRRPAQFQGSIDLATLCPECFQKLQSQFGQKLIISGGITGTGVFNGGSGSPVVNLIKNSAAVSQLEAMAGQPQEGQYGGSEAPIFSQLPISNPSSSASGTLNGEGVLQFMKNLQSQNQPQKGQYGGSEAPIFSQLPIPNPSSSASGSLNGQGVLQFIKNLQSQNLPQKYVTPEKDQRLIKVLEIVLKDNEDPNSQGTNFNNNLNNNLEDGVAQLYTIENLRKVLEVLERRKQMYPGSDKETGNLYLIIRLLLEMAIRHTQASNPNDGNGVFWYQRLSAFMANPLMKYVNNLIRQTWLQEILIQLYNNNYNMNVIVGNPRWANYLGAWTFPINLMKFINNNYEYYDQNEYGIDYDNLGEYTSGVNINPQGDAGIILSYIRNYLIQSRYYGQNGGVDFYRQQAEVFNRIAAYLRQRGYAISVIQRIIHKLYTVLNANRALVMQRPQCMSRH